MKMAESPFERDALALRRREVTFFNVIGYKKNGEQYIEIETTNNFEEDIIKQNSAAEEIDAGLHWDKANNKEPVIVRVSPLMGMRLYLEGVIKLKDLYSATTDENTIRFKKISILKTTSTTIEIVVDPDVNCDFKTFEAECRELGNH